MLEKRYDFQVREKEMQEFWEKEGIYRFDPDAPGPIYSIDTPPPTVSGSLHIGHLFSYAQVEMIVRYHRMQGENVYYPFGFDDNGLPTERLVEKEHGILAKDLPRSQFLALCRETSLRYEQDFRRFFSSLGFSVDWSLAYSTSSQQAQALSQKLFLQLVKDGKAFCKEAPVLWCTQCSTSIAQAELEVQETDSVFYTLPFLCGKKTLPVATTRPELLFGCLCLFVHPENPLYRSYIGKTAAVPLYGFEVPILADEKADPQKGSGIVMCASFGDSTDAQWIEEHGLTPKKVLLANGTFHRTVPFLSGLTVQEGKKEILRLLREQDLVLREQPLSHTVAVHERCKTPVEILSSRQWYISILPFQEKLMEAAQKVCWHPQEMKKRYLAWVENLKWDWCVSRQRYFGVPIPVWYCQSCGKPHFPKENELPVNPLEQPYQGTCSCGCREFLPETAVLDTWATSSITPLLHRESGKIPYPMSMRTHAHEIIRTWTFYSILRGLYHTGEVPWKELMISGFVLAKRGEKISKSKGNASDPALLVAEHSADALRLWAANARLGTDTFFSPEELKGEKRFLTKLWNSGKFAFPLLEDFSPLGKDPAALPLLPTDRWILMKAGKTLLAASRWLDRYEVGEARKEADRFFWNDFCDTYLELCKGRLYEEQKGSLPRLCAQYALYHSFLMVLKLYAPFAPHITESLYREFFLTHEKTPSLHLTRWPKPVWKPEDEALLLFGEQLKENLSKMRGGKTQRGLSLKAPIDTFFIRARQDLFPLFQESREDLLSCAKAAEIELLPLYERENTIV